MIPLYTGLVSLCTNQSCCWLVCCVVGRVANSLCCVIHLSHCWSQFVTLCYWFVMLVVLLVHHVGGPLHCSQVNPFVCCCSIALLVAIIITWGLVKYYPHHHNLGSGDLLVRHVVVLLPLPSTHHCHLPFQCCWFIMLFMPCWGTTPPNCLVHVVEFLYDWKERGKKIYLFVF